MTFPATAAASSSFPSKYRFFTPDFQIAHRQLQRLPPPPLADQQQQLLSFIPYGRKAFAWLTSVEGRATVQIIEVDRKRNVFGKETALSLPPFFFSSSTPLSSRRVFENECGGSVFFGSIPMSPPIVSFSPPCFVVEEVLLWKGKLSRVDDPFYEKFQMKMLVELAEEHQSLFAGAGGLILFRIPYLVAPPSTNNLELEALVGSLAYPIHHVEVKNVGPGGGRRGHILLDRAKEMTKKAVARRTTEVLVSVGGGPAGKAMEVDKDKKDEDDEDEDAATGGGAGGRRRGRFDIVADAKIDTYYLAAAEPRTHDDLVYIPNIATSTMMNSVFRSATENQDEEDNDELEDASEDKYVDLHKRARFLCEFHPKFLKWVPIQFIGNVPPHHKDM